LIEACAVVITSVALAVWLRPEDPLFTQADFSWLWVGPLVVALRHGTVAAGLAGLLLLAAWPAMQALGMLTPSHDAMRFMTFGALVTVLLCGQFTDAGRWRLRKIREVNAYLDDRLNELTRAHYLLRLSHQRIEQELLRRPSSLRDLLEQQRNALPLDTPGDLPGAQGLLDLVAQACELESASIFLVDASHRVKPTAVARLDTIASLRDDDPVLRRAMTEQMLAHVAQELPDREGAYLVAAPIRTSQGDCLGILVVERLPFLALNQENLQLLSVLLGYFADGVLRNRAIQPLRLVHREAPDDLLLEIVRLNRLARVHKVRSTVVALSFPATQMGATLLDQVKRMRRAMDLYWEVESGHRLLYISLLSLAGEPAREGYLMRVEAAFKAQHAVDFGQAGVAVHRFDIDGALDADMLFQDIVLRLGLDS
jgi:hypothetical protein